MTPIWMTAFGLQHRVADGGRSSIDVVVFASETHLRAEECV